MGGHRTISVFVAFAAMAAEEVNGTFKVTFPLIDINGIEQPLLYSCLYLQDSSSPPLEKYFSPTDHIFGLSAGNTTSLPPGNDGRCLDPHDDDPSVVNGVSAPNIAGDETSFGYYKTGHGKHGNQQAISCLDCHDPTLAHVDGQDLTNTTICDPCHSDEGAFDGMAMAKANWHTGVYSGKEIVRNYQRHYRPFNSEGG